MNVWSRDHAAYSGMCVAVLGGRTVLFISNIIGRSSSVEWTKLLQEECQELQDSNRKLKEESAKLWEETEQRERELVAECLQRTVRLVDII